MKRLLPALILSLSLASCTNKQPATDKRLCGRWLCSEQSAVYYRFKLDGSFTDEISSSAFAKVSLIKPLSWSVKGNVLYLRYSFDRYYLKFFKVPSQFTLRDTIKEITDSTLVLASPRIGKHASKITNLIKMKENGKYTTD